MSHSNLRILLLAALASITTSRCAAQAIICYGPPVTLTDDLTSSDVAIICKLIDRPVNIPPTELVECTFEVVTVLKGDDALSGQAGTTKTMRLKIPYFGDSPLGTTFLAFGAVEKKELLWNSPYPLTERAVAYVMRLQELPDSRLKRLAFCQNYLEDAEPLLAYDAYETFAQASYADLISLKEAMPRDKLLQWVTNPQLRADHRRLYLRMVSVCGTPDDLPLVEALVTNDDRQVRRALDAAISCYLVLKGVDGLPLVEDLVLKNSAADYPDTYAAIMAVRFIAKETQTIPRERLVEAMRHMLDRPELADLVIPDFIRWQDWSVIDKLVDLFKRADENSNWVRVPVLIYLRDCPLPEAKRHLQELAKLDPKAFRRLEYFVPLPAAPSDASRSKE